MVRQIGDGTLSHPTFRRYFEQNVPYLIDYARTIGLIIGKAPDRAAIDVLTRFLGQIVSAEIPANLAFLGRLGGPAWSGMPCALDCACGCAVERRLSPIVLERTPSAGAGTSARASAMLEVKPRPAMTRWGCW